MNTFIDKYQSTIVRLILTIGIFLLIYISFKYLLPFFAPFVVAFIIAMINEPLISLLQKRLRFPRKLAAIVSLLFTLSVLGTIVTLGAIKIFNELVVLQDNLSSHFNSISAQISEYADKIASYYHNLPKSITDALDQGIKNTSSSMEDVVKYLVSYIISTVTSIPKMAVSIIMTILSTYFISSDRQKIAAFIKKQIPESWAANFSGIKQGTLKALWGYFRAILILMGITFAETTIGLFIIGADYVLLMGLIVGLSDGIPVLGTGVIMVPWITFNLISGNIPFAIGLTVIYVVGVLSRQLLEPKIVGSQIGLHPLATLIAMYIGLSLFGVLGLFIGPISVIIVKNIQNSGLITIWKE